MPVRSLNSSIMRWPDRQQVHSAFSQWVEQIAAENSKLVAAGYFGSYARGDFGVGSDLDIIIVLTESDLAFERRYNVWDLNSIPVPVEAHVYTIHEWQQLALQQTRFYKTLIEETCWLEPLSEPLPVTKRA